MRLQVPGKLVVLGEYAVLDGVPALVAAVDRGVACEVTPGSELVIETPGSDDRFVRPALLAAGAPPATYRFAPWRPFNLPFKVGIGTSAAATVAAVRAGLRAAGRHDDHETVFHLAFKIHHEVQGSGSGIDVAASTYGGLLRFQGGRATVEPAPAWFPAVVWSGGSAQTGPRVQRYRSAPDRGGFVQASAALVDGFHADPVATTRSAWRLLCEMSRSARIDYRTPSIDRVVELAEQHGGAAKPSGAGGGDVVLAVFDTPKARDAFLAALPTETPALDLQVG